MIAAACKAIRVTERTYYRWRRDTWAVEIDVSLCVDRARRIIELTAIYGRYRVQADHGEAPDGGLARES